MSIRKSTLRGWCRNLATALAHVQHDTRDLAKRVMDLEDRPPLQAAQDTATGPSTPPPVGDYPPAAPCPPAASMGVAWGVSERAEDRLIELTREAIRDDLVGRRDARYLGRGPGQIVSRDAYMAMNKAQQCGKSETTLSGWLPQDMLK